MELRSLVAEALRAVLMRWASVSLLAFFCALLLLPGVVLAQSTIGPTPDTGGSGSQWHLLCSGDGSAQVPCRIPYSGGEPLTSVRSASCWDDGVTQECFYRTLQDYQYSCWDDDTYCPGEVEGSEFVMTLPAYGSAVSIWMCSQTVGPCFPGDPSGGGGDPEPDPDPDPQPDPDSAALLSAAQDAAQAAARAADAASAAGSLLFGLLGLGFVTLGFFGYFVGSRDA